MRSVNSQIIKKAILERQDFKKIEQVILTVLNFKLDEKLEPVRRDIFDIKVRLGFVEEKLEKIVEAESHDVKNAFKTIDALKVRISALEAQIRKLRTAQG